MLKPFIDLTNDISINRPVINGSKLLHIFYLLAILIMLQIKLLKLMKLKNKLLY